MVRCYCGCVLPRGVRRAISCLTLLAILSACQQSVQGQKLDTNYATTNGIGSMTGAPVSLPHGRYTFFSSADPLTCVKSVALLDRNGAPVADDASMRASMNNPPPGGGSVAYQGMLPTMVQQELPSGPYRLKVTTTAASCAWEVQQILNYLLGNEAALKPGVLPSAPALHVLLGSGNTDRTFHIDAPGIYKVDWNVTPCDRYAADLVRTGGGTIHLGDGQADLQPGSVVGPQGSSIPMFLGVGDWAARVSTHCFWQIEVNPWRGSLGGGSQGFQG